MSIGNLILGALGMYIYLRSRRMEPPPKLREWELKLRSLVQRPQPEREIPSES